MTNKYKIIIDTDIGDDIDDALAIAYALGSSEFDIQAVTTVYGDVKTRSLLARKLLDRAGRSDIPVGTGAALPMQGYYYEGTKPEECSQKALAEDTGAEFPDAADLMADIIRDNPGEVFIKTYVHDRIGHIK